MFNIGHRSTSYGFAISAAGEKQQTAHITKKRPGRKIGRAGLENGSSRLQNTPRSIIWAFRGIIAKPRGAENPAANIAGEPPETIFTTPKAV
jgi:hypothetical protein